MHNMEFHIFKFKTSNERDAKTVFYYPFITGILMPSFPYRTEKVYLGFICGKVKLAHSWFRWEYMKLVKKSSFQKLNATSNTNQLLYQASQLFQLLYTLRDNIWNFFYKLFVVHPIIVIDKFRHFTQNIFRLFFNSEFLIMNYNYYAPCTPQWYHN